MSSFEEVPRYAVNIASISPVEVAILARLAGELGIADFQVEPLETERDYILDPIVPEATVTIIPDELAPPHHDETNREPDETQEPELSSLTPHLFRCYWGSGATRVFHTFAKLVEKHQGIPLSVTRGDKPEDVIITGDLSEAVAWLDEHREVGSNSSARIILRRIASGEKPGIPEPNAKEKARQKKRQYGPSRSWY